MLARNVIILIILTMLLPAGSAESVDWPLRISESGFYLEDQSGAPFFVLGDAAWSLDVRATKADLAAYLDDRKAKGFTAILVNAIEHKFASNPPADIYGNVPFTNGGSNWSVRNSSYWSNLDYLLDEAKSRGMLVILAPAYLGYECGSEGWCVEMVKQTNSAMNEYGVWIGTRYANQGNILWLNAGDAQASQYTNAKARVAAVARGIAATGSGSLQSAHSARGRSALDDYSGESWLTVNATYSDYSSIDSRVEYDYTRSGSLPFLVVEGCYEYATLGTCSGTKLLNVQHQAMVSYLGGALVGHVYGNENVWPYLSGWGGSTGTNSPGSYSMSYIGKLMRSRPWQELVPDYGNQLVVTGKGSGATYKATARAGDGATAMIWSPNGGSVTVDMTKLSGSTANVWSWNPSDNSASLVGSYATTGTRDFTPTQGRVLVLDDAAKGFKAPGVLPALMKVSPTSVDLGYVRIGASATKEISVTNVGTKDVTVGSIEITGSAAGMFSIQSGGSSPCGGLSPTLASGATCSLVVGFTPTSTGSKTASALMRANGALLEEGVMRFSGTGTAAPVTLSQPNGGEIWETMSDQTVEWVASSAAATFRLFYSLNNGTTWTSMGTGEITGTSATWRVPIRKKNAPKCRVKVVAYDEKQRRIGADKSDKTFTIEVLTVTSPSAGTICYSGATCEIQWTKAETLDFDHGELLYSRDGGISWKKVQASVPSSDLSYQWSVPAVKKANKKCKIKINFKDTKGNIVATSTSSSNFTLSPPQ